MPFPDTDKRNAERIPLDSEIVFTYFGAQDQRQYQAQVLNHSPGGLEFKTVHPLKRGVSIYIRTTDDRVCSDSLACLRTATLAEVKWCRGHSEPDGVRYRAGVKYF